MTQKTPHIHRQYGHNPRKMRAKSGKSLSEMWQAHRMKPSNYAFLKLGGTMFDVKKILAPVALVGSIVLAPLSASAVTVTQTGVTGDPFTANGTIDVLAGASFNAVFDDGDSAGTAYFNLHNYSGSTAAVTFVVTTIQQCVLSCGFTDGAAIDRQILVGGFNSDFDWLTGTYAGSTSEADGLWVAQEQ